MTTVNPFRRTAFHKAMVHSQLKIEWAKAHIQGLADALKVEALRTVWTEVDPKTGEHLLKAGPADGVHMGIPLTVGDAVHNLNTSTDYIWSGLASYVDPALFSKVTFPRHELLANVSDMVTKSPVYKAVPEVWSLIIDRIKPYKDGNNSLWMLNKLDNACKHRMPLLTTAIYGIDRLDFRSEGTQGGTTIASSIIETSRPMLLGRSKRPFEMGSQSIPVAKIIFSEAEFFGRQPVLETLFDLTETVIEVHKAFLETFFPEGI